jgi:hypothetical protein
MTPRTLVAASAVALVMLAGGPPAYAQQHYDFTVPFSFVANGRAFTAGQYMIVPDNEHEVLNLLPKDPKAGSAFLPVETRIAETTSLAAPEVVFDRINGQLYVSELLLPGEDGYLLLVTKAKHTHQSLKGASVKK